MAKAKKVLKEMIKVKVTKAPKEMIKVKVTKKIPMEMIKVMKKIPRVMMNKVMKDLMTKEKTKKMETVTRNLASLMIQ